jgi:hypothetical protein
MVKMDFGREGLLQFSRIQLVMQPKVGSKLVLRASHPQLTIWVYGSNVHVQQLFRIPSQLLYT